MKPTDFAIKLSDFLSRYLPAQRDVSVNTIKAYRDTFKLLLFFCCEIKEITIEQITIEQLDASLVMQFLEYLEHERRCSARTRNQRLASLHSFFRYLQGETPEHILQCQRVLAIPFKRHARPPLIYLTAEQMKTILSLPDSRTRDGRRDAVLLSLLYDTGARAQELVDVSIKDIHLDPPAYVRLSGKGRKSRIVPLMKNTVQLLEDYMRENQLNVPEKTDKPLFYNRQGGRLTRWGVIFILKKYLKHAKKTLPGLRDKISPHTFRHTKAMHMLQAGVPPVIIRDFLGHADVKTTEIYARANIEMKRNALEKASTVVFSPNIPSWQKDNDLMDWLRSL